MDFMDYIDYRGKRILTPISDYVLYIRYCSVYCGIKMLVIDVPKKNNKTTKEMKNDR